VRHQRSGGCGTAVRLGVAPPDSTCWLQHTDFSETSEDLFEVLKSIVDKFSSDEEENLESYPEKLKHLFYREKMHDVLHYDGGLTVRVAPSLRHSLASTVSHWFVF
jgi:hypothetical protein